MDWRVLLTTFGVIFLAEMGDKTQLAAMTMAAQSKKPWAVFFAAAVALTAVSAIGVIAGSVLAAAALASPASAASDSAGCVGQFSSFFAHGGLGMQRSQVARQFAREDRPAGLNVYSHVA